MRNFFYICFLVILLSKQAILAKADYLMPTMVLKDAVAIDKNSDHCSPELEIPTFEKNPKRSAFNANIKCSFSCKKNDKLIERSVNQIFDSKKNGMQIGDGGLLASSTTTIIYWSQEICLNQAIVECGVLADVNSFEMKGMSSGEWIFDGKVTCGSEQKTILSPFDPLVKVDTSKNSQTLVAPIKKGVAFDWKKPFTHNFSRGESTKNKEVCSKYIKGIFCYGDCITLDQKISNELLASPNPLGSDNIEVCADDLITATSKLALSQSVKQHLCETYFLAQLKKKGATGLTCASSRFEINCPI